MPTTDQRDRSPASVQEEMTTEVMRYQLSDLIERRKLAPMLHNFNAFMILLLPWSSLVIDGVMP